MYSTVEFLPPASIRCIALLKNLERSWDSQRDDISVHDCNVFVDFGQSNNLFRVKIEYSLFSSTQSAFPERIVGLYQWLSEERIWVYFAEKYMRDNCPAFHISTL